MPLYHVDASLALYLSLNVRDVIIIAIILVDILGTIAPVRLGKTLAGGGATPKTPRRIASEGPVEPVSMRGVEIFYCC
jgi:hypothetical protein